MHDKDIFESLLSFAKIHIKNIGTVSPTGNPSEVQNSDQNDTTHTAFNSRDTSLEVFDRVNDHISSIIQGKDSENELFTAKDGRKSSFHSACVYICAEKSFIGLKQARECCNAMKI